MGKQIKLKKGFDIKIPGAPQKQIGHLQPSKVFSIKPSDFGNFSYKLSVAEGDEVVAGQSIIFDKERPEIFIPSPVSGEIVEIVRAEKRRVTHVRILADKDTKFKSFDVPSSLTRESVKETLIGSGTWSYLRQRPFDSIPDTDSEPKSVFVSLFDSSPLAPDYNYLLKDDLADLKKGLEVLGILSGGKLNIGVSPATDASLYQGVNATVNTFDGPHPAGNVGIQIHHVDPIRPGQVVWYVAPQDVVIIGRVFNSGKYQAQRKIALVGSEVQSPQYYTVVSGQSIESIVSGKTTDAPQRIIQGNVLHGELTTKDNFLSYYTNQITVIKESVEPELFGWALPGFGKLSLNHSFPSWLMPKKVYNLDTRINGEERAFVVTGEYEKVLPMNIMPVFLLKSILAGDIERMENLGIHEVSEEDFALCEFVCTSKIDVQNIIKQGLDLLRKEG